MRLAQLNTEGTVIDKIYEKEECALYGWTSTNMPVFEKKIKILDITNESSAINEGWLYKKGVFSKTKEDIRKIKQVKTEEIREAALAEGRVGATILADMKTGQSYHMALTPDDVSLLQQANMVAKIAWEAMALPKESEYRIAELKEKWEDGTTKLHLNVPEKLHDTVLAIAAIKAGEIYRKQEVLIQAVNDAKTVEEIEKICW